jgi:transglutaminase-like putative cysteine protease
VKDSVSFDYMQASATRTASETIAGGQGVCRDFAHLAIAFCRCMNIPARYCTGYLSEIGEPAPLAPDDFAAWMEVFLDGQWWVFDPRNNNRRIGRILIARGRDAADVPLTQTFGPSTLTQFDVWTWDAENDPRRKRADRAIVSAIELLRSPCDFCSTSPGQGCPDPLSRKAFPITSQPGDAK